MRIKISSLVVLVFLTSSRYIFPQPDNIPLFEKIGHKISNIKFKNSLLESDSANMISFINFYTGSGVGIIDINNDGLQDIFFAGNQVTSRLYLNKGGFRFKDITLKAGVSTHQWITGVSVVDINQDGFDDIYLSVSGSLKGKTKGNLLFINDKDNTFSEKADEYNLASKEQTTHTSFFDFDNDSYLDALLATNPTDFKLNSTDPLQKPKINGESPGTDILFHNEGNGKFKDVSKKSGILLEGYSLGVNTSDFNHDGWIDIYLSNDYISNDILYINNGNGTFSDKLEDFFDYTSFASMGNDAADINNDGLIDIITLDMLPESSFRQKLIVGTRTYEAFMHSKRLGYFPQFSRNMLQLNNGNNTFSEIGGLAGISKSDWSWAPLLIDFDNDGYKDLFVTAGFRRDLGNMDFIYKTVDSPFRKDDKNIPESAKLQAIKRVGGIPVINYVFKNNHDLSFSNVSEEWGFDEKNYSSGVATADLDNDGDLEIIINNVDDYASIYQNRADQFKNHFLKVRLRGFKNNLSGIGSKITIYYSGNLQYIDNNPYRGYMSTVEKNIIFGIGNYTMIDSLVTVWPDGTHTVQFNLPVDRTLDIEYSKSLKQRSEKTGIPREIIKFREISKELGIDYKHKEDVYVDFHNQVLLPFQYSQLGPCVAVGDINNDNLEDFFIGGARGFPGMLFFQTSKGTFRTEEFSVDKEYEDMGALLFDFDGDKDLDLYVVSGGTFAGHNSDLYQDRLYENIGYGKFKKTKDVLPAEKSSGSVVTATDFDRDGDLDLFVGGRILPLKIPNPPESYLLENRNGRFIDVTNYKSPGLSSVGMITSALWSDFNTDGYSDLILTGEWMPVTIFENRQGTLINLTKQFGLENTSGWWNSISSGDFDGNGTIEYVLGNLGLNNQYSASITDPLKMVSHDFDNDGISEPLLIMKYVDGYFPIASRSLFLSAFPLKSLAALASRFLTTFA
jgi:hypothetical protein